MATGIGTMRPNPGTEALTRPGTREWLTTWGRRRVTSSRTRVTWTAPNSARHTGSPAASTRDSWLSAARPPRWRSTALARSRCRSASSVGARVAYQPVQSWCSRPVRTSRRTSCESMPLAESCAALRTSSAAYGSPHRGVVTCRWWARRRPGWRRTRASVDGAGRASGGVDPATLAGLGDAGGSEPPARRWLRTIRVARDRHGRPGGVGSQDGAAAQSAQVPKISIVWVTSLKP